MDQLHLPMDLEVDNPPNHLIRVVNEAVNRLDDQSSPLRLLILMEDETATNF
jgi:hypothetical protein